MDLGVIKHLLVVVRYLSPDSGTIETQFLDLGPMQPVDQNQGM